MRVTVLMNSPVRLLLLFNFFFFFLKAYAFICVRLVERGVLIHDDEIRRLEMTAIVVITTVSRRFQAR